MDTYEKKYKEALERARSMYESKDDAELASFIFPELRESEDERTRKEIIGFIRSQIEDGNSVGWDRWIAYLEKQKEQKPVEWEDIKDKVNIPYCSSEQEWSEEDEK